MTNPWTKRALYFLTLWSLIYLTLLCIQYFQAKVSYIQATAPAGPAFLVLAIGVTMPLLAAIGFALSIWSVIGNPRAPLAWVVVALGSFVVGMGLHSIMTARLD